MVKTVHIVLGSPENSGLIFTRHPEDKVIGVDYGALLVLNNRKRLDVAIGDFDSVTADELMRIKEEATEFRQFNADKDDTDAEIALELAEALYQPEQIILYNWSGGRMDHLLNLLFLVHQPRFQPIIQKLIFKNKVNTIHFYTQGKYSIEKDEGKYYLAFIGMTPLKGLTVEGAKYPVTNLDVDYPVTLVSNEITEKTCVFSFDEGLLAVIQSIK
ncbi:MAG: thiamine diphosphokinase [Alkalibacterium sp.]|nr:thiamine diphosphokinase [Alkalibacterium sp.]